MRALPPVAEPWSSRIDRRHGPSERLSRHGYRAYRACLRWEFGFSCAFCLCHEADLTRHGAQRSGQTEIEHFIPVSRETSRANAYDNCFYVCRYCNRARATQSNVDPEDGGRLLDPCTDTWAERFVVRDDRLQPKTDDRDAGYTHKVYDLDDPRKVEMRRFRRETLSEAFWTLERGSQLYDEVLAIAEREGRPELIDAARELDRRMSWARGNLRQFAAIPRDAPTVCACKGENRCALPQVLGEQTILITEIAEAGGPQARSGA